MTTIPASQLVQVNPSVVSVGGSAINVIGLMLTNGARAPIGQVLSFSSAAAVSSYFGPSSVEAAKAAIYFGGFTNSSKKPASLLVAQYNQSAVAAFLRGATLPLTLAQLQALSGTFIVIVDGVTRTSGTINLSGATSFSNAATLIQTALNAGGANPTIANLTGVIASGVLTASAVTGTIAPGQQISGVGITAGVWIVSQLSGTTGGAGTYQLSQSINQSSEAMTTNGVNIAVTFDSISSAFVLTSGVTGAVSSVAQPTGTLPPSLNMTAATGDVISAGAAAAVPAAFMNAAIQVNPNFVTFFTTFDPDGGSGNAIKQAFAVWKNTQNNSYAYVCRDTDPTAPLSVPASTSLGQLLPAINDSGTCLCWEPSDLNLDAAISGFAASIDFSKAGGRITFAFKAQAGLTPGVTDPTSAVNLAGNPQALGSFGNNYNFYGAYAQGNNAFTFFQRGTVTGPYLWFDSYINQIWLNANLQAALLNLVANALSIPFSTQGASQITAALNDPINAGLSFGAFGPGVISASEIASVNAAAGTDVATTLQAQGWYLQVLQQSSTIRANRGPWAITFWYLDRGSVQSIVVNSVAVQ